MMKRCLITQKMPEMQETYTGWHSLLPVITNSLTMRTILFLIALVLIIGWLLGVFVYSATGIIHALLVIAIISVLLGFIRRGSVD